MDLTSLLSCDSPGIKRQREYPSSSSSTRSPAAEGGTKRQAILDAPPSSSNRQVGLAAVTSPPQLRPDAGIPVWRYPAKRLLLAVTSLQPRFPGDAPGNLAYIDFRSAESKVPAGPRLFPGPCVSTICL